MLETRTLSYFGLFTTNKSYLLHFLICFDPLLKWKGTIHCSHRRSVATVYISFCVFERGGWMGVFACFIYLHCAHMYKLQLYHSFG